MDLGIIVLRLLHVASGILWAGGAVITARFLEPTAEELGAAAGPFMTEVMEKRRMGIYFQAVGGLTVVFGSVLYWIDSHGDPIRYLTGGGMGLGLGIAGILAWIAFLIGSVYVGPNAMRMSKIQKQLRDIQGPPPAELVAGLEKAQGALKRAGEIDFALLVIVIVCMATARYW